MAGPMVQAAMGAAGAVGELEVAMAAETVVLAAERTRFNMSLDTEPQQQAAASPRVLRSGQLRRSAARGPLKEETCQS